jgi:hypothetical protein
LVDNFVMAKELDFGLINKVFDGLSNSSSTKIAFCTQDFYLEEKLSKYWFLALKKSFGKVKSTLLDRRDFSTKMLFEFQY